MGRYTEIRERNLEFVRERFHILDEVDASSINNSVIITVTNKSCGHTFTTKFGFLVNGTKCQHTECRTAKSKEFLTKLAKEQCSQEKHPNLMSDSDFIDLFEREKLRLGFIVSLYNFTGYYGSKHKLEVICDMCQTVSSVRPSMLLWRPDDKLVIGCNKCKKNYIIDKFRFSINEVKNNIYSAHGDKYSYPNLETEYENNKSYLTIICATHGEFKQQAVSHILYEQGCPVCAHDARRKTLEQFIDEANIAHNFKYDYSLVEYKTTACSPAGYVQIICPDHGKFWQLACSHLYGHGCSKCVTPSYSRKAIKWLESIMESENINIQHAENGGEYRIPQTGFSADGYCQETNTIYEFHGSIFHGDPNKFKPDVLCNPYNKNKTAKELYDSTVAREDVIKSLGYNLIVIWESEYDSKK